MAESALLAAITVLMMFFGTFLPVLGIFIVLAWPVPIMVVVLRHGLRYGIMAVIVTAVLAMLFLGILQAVFGAVALVGFIGLIFGVGLVRDWDAPTLIGAGAIMVAVSFLVAILVMGPLMGISLLDQIQYLMVESIERAEDMYRALGTDPERLEQTFEELRQAMEYLQLVFPAVIMFSAITYATWTYFITRLILPRLGYEVPEIAPFARWRAPPWLAAVLIGAFFHQMFAGGADTILSGLARNALFAANMAYFLFGVALLYYFVRHFVQNKWISVIVCFFLAMNAVMVLVLPLAAILDSGLDFRARFAARGGAG